MLTGDATRGATLFKSEAVICNSCHGENGEGNQGPNITKSVAGGIGSWTYAQFHDAVRLAKDKDGADLCAFMVAVPEKDLSEQGIADVYAFLQSKPAVDVPNKGMYCP